MHVFTSLSQVSQDFQGAVIAIGNFDGLHLGHQALLNKVCEKAQGKPKGVLTFNPHPREILCADQIHFSLCTFEQRVKIFAQFGLDMAVIHHLTRDFLNLSAQQFIDDVLVATLKVSQVVVGDDFRFGAGALGDVSLLLAPKNAARFTTHIVSPVFCENQRCSSSTIRKLLSEGNLTLSKKMLGRNFSLAGQVTRGAKMGAALGFKTANLVPPIGFQLSRGVYATVVRTGGGDFVACTNVGVRPSVVEKSALMVESHLLDVDVDLYDQEIEVFFIKRLRDEKKFSSLKSLVEQVQTDLQTVRQMYFRSPLRFQIAN